jgi:hypothetical protein
MNRIKRDCAARDHFITTYTEAPPAIDDERANISIWTAPPAPHLMIC